jgi:hypothetical protein
MTREDLTITIQPYNGANIGGVLTLQGYVDVMHGNNLICHHDMPKIPIEQARLEGLTAEALQTLADNEADTFLASEMCNSKIDDYIFAYNLGLYGA